MAENESAELLNKVDVMVRDVIQSIHERKLTRFDPYIVSGYKPSENNFSDSLKRLFDPTEHHGFSHIALRALIEAIEIKYPAKATAILEALDDEIRETDGQSIRLDRERPNRVDISIVGKSFIVFIENKKRGGSETQSAGGRQQVENQQVALDALGNKLGVPEDRRLGIFLNPEGNTPSAPKYLLLSTRELASALRRELDANASHGDERERCLVRAFVESYDFLNGGGRMNSARVQTRLELLCSLFTQRHRQY
jgi:hypothetical protein